MSIKDPFNLPEAVVGVTVEGANNIAPSKGKHYPLNADEDEEITWQAVSGRLEARDSMATRVRIYLGDGVDAVRNLGTKLSPISFLLTALKRLKETLFIFRQMKTRAYADMAYAIPSEIIRTMTLVNEFKDFYHSLAGTVRPGRVKACAKRRV